MKQSSSKWLLAVLACCTLLPACRKTGPDVKTVSQGSFRPQKLNVVLVSLDTLRADHLHTYGYERQTSPSFDRLAKTSVLFEDCMAQAPHTHPSHLSMFESRRPAFCGDSYPMLAELLHGAGYRTVAFTDGGHLSGKMGFSRGFDSYREYGQGFEASFPDATTWLLGEHTKPFFLFLHSYDIHAPYHPPAPLDTMFTDPNYTGPMDGPNTRQLIWKLRRRKQYRDLKEKVVVPQADKDQFEALYDGEIRFADGYLEKLIQLLKEQQLWKNTILIVFSDHGEEFWDHGSVSHGHTLYQELLHVALLIHLPGDAYGGTRIHRTVRLLDLSPTILGLLGLDAETTHQGDRLIPELLSRKTQALLKPSFAETFSLKSIRQGEWKLIINVVTGKRLLFNLREDPKEQHSLLQSRPKIAQALEAELQKTYGELEHTEIDVDKAAEAVTDPKLRDQLRALGYIE